MQASLSRQQKLRRLALDAVLIALFVVFSTVFSFETPFFEVSLVGLPIILCARLFGVKDAFVVALLGSFLEQLTSPYGLSLSTLFWMLPTVTQALFASLCFFVMREEKNRTPVLLSIIILSELVLTVVNTSMLYLDGYVMGYAVKALHLIALPRTINSGVRMLLSCVLIPLLLPPIQRLLEMRKES